MKKREFVTVKIAADYLGVHQETIRRMLQDGRLSGEKTLLNQWRVDWDRLQEIAPNYRAEDTRETR